MAYADHCLLNIVCGYYRHHYVYIFAMAKIP